ncbi:MAG: Wzz/FepE/Etk N-terminal domain-containing protein, partial [Candidatus Zixiibacteriota bacterium]
MRKVIQQRDCRDTVSSDMSSQPERDIEINPVELCRLFLRKRRLILASVAVSMALAAVIMLLSPNQYTSRATILPTGTSGKLSGLTDLRGSIGLGEVPLVGENSSALYPSILRSDLVREKVLDREYTWQRDRESKSLTLSEYFDIDDPNLLKAALGKITRVSTDRKLGIVAVSVQTECPELSQQVLQEHLTGLEWYLSVKRRSHARERVRYLTTQLDDHGKELRVAEDSLEQFLNVNRDWQISGDPELQTELGRLRREVEVRSKTYLLLAQHLEQARLDAQDDVPIVRILDQPSLPTFKSGPARTLTVIAVGLGVFLLMLAGLFVVHMVGQLRHGPAAEGFSNLQKDFRAAFPVANRLFRSRESER